ncbi:MAG: Crp/Fnr family transcriptional regulator [Bacteroidetes bacterium]|nr:Crp/Fnr family transcriptional regulator [Bacteroidota bacterium]
MNSFKNFIQQYTRLPENDWQIINHAFERIEIKKNEVFVEEGKICRYLYFLEKGLLRYFIIKEGNDITKTFTIAPYLFTSTLSFRNQKPAKESIQAIEKCIVWRTSYHKMRELTKLNSWNLFTSKVVNEVQEFAESLLLEVRTETAEKRYEKLLTEYSDIIDKISLKHLSSFLGIAPQSLSRIRKKLQEKT